ncbi:hypothetical protein SAMN05444050_3507 [Afipia sp. GAS231]|nr:hypothetical protein SAMN05444050_3507 [Afipia sp. GAS231]
MEVGSPDIPITGMVKIGDRLHILKTDSIHRITLADDIDPERTNINVPNSQQKVLDVGSGSPLVGKTLLTAKQLFESGFLGNQFDKGKAIDLSFEALKNLTAMFEQASVFRDQDEEEEKRVSEQVVKNRTFVLPSAPDVERRCKEFVQSADHALQALFGIGGLFYGDKIKGWFEGLADEISRLHEGDAHYIGFMGDAAKFCKSMRITRNCIEHRKPNERVEILNYTLTPANELLPPMIAVHHPKFIQPKMPVSTYTDQVTNHIADTFEQMIAFMCSRNVDRSVGLPMTVVELPTDQRSNQFVKYSFGIDAGGQVIPAG